MDGTPNANRRLTPSQVSRIRHATVLDAFRYREVISFVMSFTFWRMHQFAYFITTPFYMTYVKYRQEDSLEYLGGAISGTIIVGALVGRVLANKIYLAIAVLHTMLLVYTIISFKFDDDIMDNLFYRKIISGFLGFTLETSSFIYTCILPLQIARDITNHKLKSFSRQLLDPNTHSFVGTVVGALLGATFINDTIIFANLNFVFQAMVGADPPVICALVCAILFLSIASVYREIKRELLRVPCIRKCFPKKLRSYTVTHIDP